MNSKLYRRNQEKNYLHLAGEVFKSGQNIDSHAQPLLFNSFRLADLFSNSCYIIDERVRHTGN